MFSPYLASRHELCRQLLTRLKDRYEYVSILGKHITGRTVRVTTASTFVGETQEKQCGFVVKLYNGSAYSEYSFTDITQGSIDGLEKAIIASADLPEELLEQHADMRCLSDEPLIRDFSRPIGGSPLPVPQLIEKLSALRDKVQSVSGKIVQAIMNYTDYEVSALFLSKNRELKQDYGWCSIMGAAVAREGSTVQNARDVAACNDYEEVFRLMEQKAEQIGRLAEELLRSELIKPGVYDIITAPSITGLIAHEAFGHGVEMDMFVKHRAKARRYVGKPVASPLVTMHDGAAAVVSCVGYFFDDDGVLAQDTVIIKDGILEKGISDAVSAAQLGTAPTGNGRRQDPSRKAYTRMTNTFFAPGSDKLEDMIASVKHGYMLFQTSNGMEDPKNWNIQCVAQYGREIEDGRFTGRTVAPVVMSGYVPDLLMSISMVSDTWEVIGSGHCGKGYKEWVPVSDGGPYLKARCKLG